MLDLMMMNLQFFAEDAAAVDPDVAAPATNDPDGADNQPEVGNGAPEQPENVTMTQEQLNALIDKAYARGARKGKREAVQTPAAGDNSPPADDTAATAVMEKAHALLINAALRAAALDAGFIDPTDALAADRASIDVDEDGNVDGADEAVKALLKQKPHYAKRKESGPVGGGVNGGRHAVEKEPLGAQIAKRHRERAQRADKALEPFERR